MSDPTPDDAAVKQDEQLNFNWWLTMLPFLALIGWFLYQWSRDPHDSTPLLCAGGALLAGLVVGALVASASGDTAGGASDAAEQTKSS